MRFARRTGAGLHGTRRRAAEGRRGGHRRAPRAGFLRRRGRHRGGCFSACVYSLMGASRRVIPTRSRVGIHRMFAYQDEPDSSGIAMIHHRRYDNGEMRAFLMRYSADMGISPGIIVAAEHISSDDIKILSPAEIRRWHLGVSKR